MNRQRAFAVIAVLMILAIVGGIILEANTLTDRIDTIPPQPIG